MQLDLGLKLNSTTGTVLSFQIKKPQNNTEKTVSLNNWCVPEKKRTSQLSQMLKMPLSPFTSTQLNSACPVKINPFRIPVAVSGQKPRMTFVWTKNTFHSLREKQTNKQSFTAVFQQMWSISAKDACVSDVQCAWMDLTFRTVSV